MPSVLFVCTANRYRSPIAAAAFTARLKEKDEANQWLVGSAGTWTKPGLPPLPVAIQMARKYGLDIEKNTSRPISEALLSQYDLILVMEKGQKEALGTEFPGFSKRIYLLSEIADGRVYDIPDPAHFENEADEVIRDMLGLIRAGYEKIARQALILHQAH